MKKLLFPSSLALLIAGLFFFGPETPAEDPRQEPPPETEELPASNESLDTFVPTEQLTADSAISFPVDI